LGRPRCRFLALAILPALLGALPAAAQATTGALTGTARTAAGGLLAGVKISARHLDTGLVRSTISDEGGRYELPNLPVGAYELRAEAPGFRTVVRQGLGLVVGVATVADIVLEVGVPAEEVTVVAESSLVQTRGGELSYLVSAKSVQDLPLNGRNYTDLALLQPGVVAFPHRDGGSIVAHGLGMSINGQDPRANVYLLDGTLLNDFTNAPASSAAGTALGTETVREFRVEVNAYGAEYGRNAGGQISVVTKSGTNELRGSAYEFHRNDALDARNFFDVGDKPDFHRNQFGATLGGPLQQDRTFLFLGYEGLREELGRTIQSVVPDQAARLGVLPGRTVPVSPAVRPYLDAFPLPNGPALGGGLASFSFPFSQTIDQDYFQVRLDHNLARGDQVFVRYTLDRAAQVLPTDFPQFPRAFSSKNQFLTAEYRHVASTRTFHSLRLGFSRTRIDQSVEANVSLPAFVPGQSLMGSIDIGGIPRFGTQSSADVSLRQKVFAGEYGLIQARGRHLLKAGLLAERYVDDMYNPTFSLGIYTFADLESFLRNVPQRFVGIVPGGDLERNWRFTLLAGYLQDDWRLTRRLTVNLGLRYEYATLPRDLEGRDSTLLGLLDRTPSLGQLYQNPTGRDVSPRFGFAWDATGDGRTSLRGGLGLYFNTNNQQNLIVTVTNPPATPRPVIASPTFPTPDFTRPGAISIRPVQWDLVTPRTLVWNLAVQRALPAGAVVTLGYAGARGRHLLRNTDANVPTPQTLADGTLFFPVTAARPNTTYSTIEIKTSDGDSWYNALILEVRRAGRGLSLQSSYTFSRNIDTTQASTFFSDATSGTTSAFPEFGRSYNKGLADFHAKHNWVYNLTWEVPLGRSGEGLGSRLLRGWQAVAIGQMRSGPPLTLFVQANRSRSRWAPSLGPGQGNDRPSLAPGRTPESAILGQPDQWFDPTAFVLPAAGTLGNLGRGALIGPDLKVLDLALVKHTSFPALGPRGQLELRVEVFNVLNRVNLGIPALQAFAGQRDGEQALPTLGRIRSTVTAARQMQLGLRLAF
jgi:hypothetical protein